MGRGRGQIGIQKSFDSVLRARTSKRSFPLLEKYKDDPRFEKERQIALDLDDTVYPILRAVQPWAQEDLNYSLISKHGKLIELLGGPEKSDIAFKKAFSFEHSKNIGLLPGASVAMKELARMNISVHAMTHRPDESYEDTARWLDYYNIPYSSLACQSPIDKIAMCKEKEITIIVDDKDALMITAKEAGIEPLSLSLPYNEKTMNNLEVPDANNWGELTDHIFALIEERIRLKLEV